MFILVKTKTMAYIIISSSLNIGQEKRLVEVLGRYKKVIRWIMADIMRILPQQFSRITEVIKPYHKESCEEGDHKIADTGIIYPISDNSYVSLVQCVPKKGGVTVVVNEKNKFISTRTGTR